MKAENYKIFYILLDIFLIGLLALSIANNFLKPIVNFDDKIQDRVIIININNIAVNDIIEAEYLTDLHSIGDTIRVGYKLDGKTYTNEIVLQPYYDFKLGFILVLTVLIYIFLAVYVIRIRFVEFESRAFHNVTFSAALLIGMTWGGMNHFPLPLDFFLRLMYDASYLWLGVNLFKFSLIFPRIKIAEGSKFFTLMYGITIGLIVITGIILFPSFQSESIESFRKYWLIHSNLIVPIFSLIVLLSLASFIHSYISFRSSLERQKIRWILIGVFIAVLNFTVLWLIPKHIFKTRWIDEATMILLTLPAPVTMFIAIVKYRIFNIDKLISKTTLYTILAIILTIFYSIIIPLTGIPDANVIVPLSFTTIIALILINNFNRRIQILIDRVLFREKLDQKRINDEFTNRTNGSYSGLEALEALNNALIESKIYENIFISVLDLKNFSLMYESNSQNPNISSDISNIISELGRSNIYSGNRIIIADKNAVEKEVSFFPLSETIFSDLGSKVVLISFSLDRSIAVIVRIGDNVHRVKFNSEDIESMVYKTNLAVNIIYKIQIMNEIAARDEENKKLKELNDMKSWFVSSVSHELKTPLTSIRMFSEILEVSDNLDKNKRNEYLAIIQQECDRLTRLINNVLDFSKIEKGVKQLNKKRIELVAIIEHCFELTNHDLKKNDFTVNRDFKVTEAIIQGDRDSFIEVFINLIMNSIKYSGTTKSISIQLSILEKYIQIIFEDKGIGISQENLPNIFEPFFRVKSEKTLHQGGTGIGLSIVKNIIIAHDGTIHAESVLGAGTRFIINLPTGENDE
jgi:signal transduction histidine kinase